MWVLDELRPGQDGEALRFTDEADHDLHSATLGAVLPDLVRFCEGLGYN